MIPYRAFTHLLTPEDQMQALQIIREYLIDGGKLVINNSDPRLKTIVRELAHTELPLQNMADVIRPDNGHRVVVWKSISYDPETQVHSEDRIFEETEGERLVLSGKYTPLVYLYTHRYEMQYLLRLSGFEVEALYGDF